MLRELLSSGFPNKENRRWFSDDYFDLIIWFQREGSISGFQLCYDKQGRERALTWRSEGGFSHESVDTGEMNPAKNRSPVLVPDGACPVIDLTDRFQRESRKIDTHLANFIIEKLILFRRISEP